MKKSESKTATKEFMLLFRFNPAAMSAEASNDNHEEHNAWGAYIGGLAMQEKLVSTHQLGFDARQVYHDKAVGEGIYIAEDETLGGNMVIKAIDIDEAVEIAKGCPILQIGGSVEVREITPMG
jgi:hypothetical protein